MTIRKCLLVTLLILPVMLVLAPAPVDAKRVDKRTETEKEVDLGKEAVKDVEKEVKLINDEAVLKRVQTIGENVARVAIAEEVPASYGDASIAKFNYTFKVIDDKNVNAFSLPGGFIYVNKGLLDFVQSDHELAGVLAHEIAHAAHHHVKSLTREQSRLHRRLALILLAGLIGKIPQTDLGHVMLGTQFYKTARLSGYGQLAEKDADITAVRYLAKTDYNPVGMLTFLERLSRGSDIIDLGILQTHPKTDDRISDVYAELQERNIPINRRKVTNAAIAEIKDVEVGGQKVHELSIGGKSLVKLSGDAARVDKVRKSVNLLLDSPVALKDIASPDDRCCVMAKGSVLLEINQVDAELNALSRYEVAAKISDGIRRVLWQEMVDLIR